MDELREALAAATDALVQHRRDMHRASPRPCPTCAQSEAAIARARAALEGYSRTLPVMEHIYVSTYCQHGVHKQCRLECKICQAPCRCTCHDPKG